MEAFTLIIRCLNFFDNLTQSNMNHIAFLINNFEPNGVHPEIFCNGRADLKIIEDLEERFGK